MKYALIENGIVKQIVNKKFSFAENEVVFFKECNDDIKENYLYKDGKFTTPPKQKPKVLKLTYEQKRLAEYGDVAKQIEYITENGLVAWKKKVEAIKAKYPKN